MSNLYVEYGKTIAFIPIRSGSKGIKDKNIKEINGEPLIYWVLNSLEKSQIDKIVVALDSEKYKRIIKNFNFNKVIFYDRDEENAMDGSTTEDVVLEYLGKGYENNDDIFLLVQATNPLISSKDINAVLNEYKKGLYNSILSVADLNHRFLWNEGFSQEHKRFQANSINYDFKHRPLRQKEGLYKKDIYMENGAMYINTVDNIVKSKNRLTDPVGLFVMGYYTHLEVDTELDFKIIELILRELQK